MMFGNTCGLRQMSYTKYLCAVAELLDFSCYLQGNIATNTNVDFIEYQSLKCFGIKYRFKGQSDTRDFTAGGHFVERQ